MVYLRVTDNLFIYPWQGTANNCHTYALAGEFLTIIDPGYVTNEAHEPCLQHLEQSMLADGLRLADVRLILLTHGHPDHAASASTIKERSGAHVAIHEAEITNAADKWSLEPDIYLGEGRLALGRRQLLELEVLHVPGHSPGSLAYYWPQARALFPGDVLFAGSVGRTDLPGGNPHDLAQSINRLAKLDVEWFFPGHTQPLRGRENYRQNLAYIATMFLRG